MADMGRRMQPKRFEGESKMLIMGIPIEEFHENLTPIEYCKLYLNSREKRFIKHLMRTGEYDVAHSQSGFSVPCQNVLSRRHIKIALFRMAPLATDPKISAKMLHPLITEQRLYIAATSSKASISLKALDALSDQAETGNVKKSLVARVDLPPDRIRLADRPWAVPLEAIRNPPSLPDKAETEDEEDEREDIE